MIPLENLILRKVKGIPFPLPCVVRMSNARKGYGLKMAHSVANVTLYATPLCLLAVIMMVVSGLYIEAAVSSFFGLLFLATMDFIVYESNKKPVTFIRSAMEGQVELIVRGRGSEVNLYEDLVSQFQREVLQLKVFSGFDPNIAMNESQHQCFEKMWKSAFREKVHSVAVKCWG